MCPGPWTEELGPRPWTEGHRKLGKVEQVASSAESLRLFSEIASDGTQSQPRRPPGVLSNTGLTMSELLQQNITHSEDYKQQKFTAYSSGG